MISAQQLRRVKRFAQRKLAGRLKRSEFFLQGQMDINPLSAWASKAFIRQTGGFFIPGDVVIREVVDLEPWDLVRRDMLVLLLRSLNERAVSGDMAELGVYQGATAKLLHHYMPDRLLHLFDTFTGFDPADIKMEGNTTGKITNGNLFANTSVQKVMEHIQPRNENLRCYRGRFPNSIPVEFGRRRFSFVHLDADLYEPTIAGLRFFYDKVVPGGFIVVHDYNAWPGARKAVNEFFHAKPEVPVPMPDKSGSALISKIRAA